MQNKNGYLSTLSHHAHPLEDFIVTETLIGAIAVVIESMIDVARKEQGVIEGVATDHGGLTVIVVGITSIMTITMATKMGTTRSKKKATILGRAGMAEITGNILKVSIVNCCQYHYM